MTSTAQNNSIVLNTGQKNAIKEIYDFLHDDKLAIILTGSAGTGKSYLINYIIDKLLPAYQSDCKMFIKDPVIDTVELAATTNKAASVISSSYNLFTPTVHSLFNLILRNNFNTGETTISRSKKWTVKTKTLFIIDEYTMINKELYRHLLDSVNLDTCKFIFVGDKNQLSPVKENHCIVDKQGFEVIELTEPVRNSNSPALMDLCEQFRNTVLTGEFKDIKLTSGSIEWVTPQEAGRLIENDFIQGKDSRILAYTNNAVISYNDYIRSAVGFNTPKFQQGEVLTVNETVNCIVHAETATLNTDTLIEIVAVGADDNYRFSTNTDNPVEINIPFYTVRAKIISGNVGTSAPVISIHVPMDIMKVREATKYLAKIKDWVNHFKVKETFADLRPVYSTTVHKSQGSTFDTVYVDLNDISKCRNPEMAKRLFYVAVSRPRNKIVFFGELTPKYGRFIQ